MNRFDPPEGFVWTEYELPLRAPTTAGGEPVRRGLLIALDGAVGEAAPLPGLHAETLDEMKAALPRVRLPRKLEGDARALLWELNNATGFAKLPPSLRFAVESAVLRRGADRAGLSLTEFLWPGEATFSLPSVGLFAGRADQAAEMLERGDFAPYAGVKIKIGRADPAQDLRTIETFRSRWPQATIRLDANRALDRAAVDELERVAADLAVECVEDPFADREELAAYLEDHLDGGGLPLALDETLVEAVRAGRRPYADPPVAAWVIKPSCLGVLHSLWLVESSFDLAAIVSSSFETEVGREMLLALAAGSDAHPGLGTDRWFGEELAPAHVTTWRPVAGGAA